ncbi:MAG: VWA domain-containing protein [Desulfobacterota bacterium]|nr:VWA domain-containing protein [Thermodesulfobacteriota bacterium]
MTFGNLAYIHILWIVPALIMLYLYAFLKKDAALKALCGEELAERLVPAGTRRRQQCKAVLMLMAVLCIAGALMRPRWGFHWETVQRSGVDIIIAVDVSKSMLATDIEPNRLERAKRKIHDLIGMLEGDRIGLVAFAGTAFVQCPLTLDYGACRMFLEHLGPDLIPVPGTAIGDALRASITAFTRHERTSKAVILITDGEDHDTDPLAVAREAKKRGIKIFTIGIGSDTGAPVPQPEGSGFLKDQRGNVVVSKLNEQMLQQIALETGGTYVRSVTGDMDLHTIYRENIRAGMERTELSATRTKRWEERFQWFVAAALLLLLIESFISEGKLRGAAVRTS